MIKKLLILHFCLVTFLIHPMKEDDGNQNNENTNQNNHTIEQNRIENSDQNKKLLIKFIDTDKPVYIQIPNTLAERIPLINFSPSDNILKIPYGEKPFKMVIEIVKVCPFNNEDEKIIMAYNYFKKNKAFNKIKDFHKIKNFNEDSTNFSYAKNIFSQNKTSDLNKKLYAYNQQKKTEIINLNNNIGTIEKLFEQQPLLERIETLLVADYLKLPSSLLDDIIYGLNIKFMNYDDLMSIEKYNFDKNICEKIKGKRIFFKRDYSSKKLKLSFIEEDNYCAEFSPNQRLIALSLGAPEVNLWDYEQNKVETINNILDSYPLNLTFNPQGSILAIKAKSEHTYKNMIHLWDVKNKKLIFTIKPHINLNDKNMVFSSDGKFLYAVREKENNDGSFIEFDIENKKITTIKEQNQLKGVMEEDNDSNEDEDESFTHIEYLANNITKPNIVIASNFRLFFYDLKNCKNKDLKNCEARAIKIKTHQGDIKALKFNPATQLLASASERVIKLWDISSYKNICSLEGHTDSIEDIAFSPDGKILVSASLDKTIKLWDTRTGTCVKTFTYDEALTTVAFNSDGTLICTVNKYGNLSLLSLNCPEELSLQQIIFLIYLEEKNNIVDEKYKKIYKSLPDTVKKKIDKPQWVKTRKNIPTNTLKLFNFEKK